MIIVCKVHLKLYKWKSFTIQVNPICPGMGGGRFISHFFLTAGSPKWLNHLYWHFLTFPKYWNKNVEENFDSNFLPQPPLREVLKKTIFLKTSSVYVANHDLAPKKKSKSKIWAHLSKIEQVTAIFVGPGKTKSLYLNFLKSQYLNESLRYGPDS